ncbi:MAG: hypothetical protein JWP52_2083 [Rhizobacter sp.]|nr:hypothetical protein [Rhizobacter sp.]
MASTELPNPPEQASPAPEPGQRWHDLLSKISSEVSGPLTAALERIHALTTTGRIDRQSLRALREEVEFARQAGMIGQQIARFASAHLRQSPERMDLVQTLRSLLAHRFRETQARGIQFDLAAKPVDVQVDASLLFSLLNTMVDWAMTHAQSPVSLRIEARDESTPGRLVCQFHQAATAAPPTPATSPPRSLDTLNWSLLEQTAWTMGLLIERSDDASKTTLTLGFPRTLDNPPEPLPPAADTTSAFEPSTNSKPLAGSHVLVLAARRDLRIQVRDAVSNMGLIVDYVSSVEEAVDFCREGLPHAIVVEQALTGEDFLQLRSQIVSEVPEFAFIELVEDGTAFEISSFSSTQMTRVGRAVIRTSLPSALLFELSKSL